MIKTNKSLLDAHSPDSFYRGIILARRGFVMIHIATVAASITRRYLTATLFVLALVPVVIVFGAMAAILLIKEIASAPQS